jgi:hypothetical protein
MQELASSAINSLTPYLRKIDNTAILKGREVAAKVLYDLISFAFQTIGRQADWDAYVDNPVERVAVEELLATALINKPHLAGDMERVVRFVMNYGARRHVDCS